MIDFAKHLDRMKRQAVVVIDGDNFVKRCILCAALDDLKAGKTFTGGIYGALCSLSSMLTVMPMKIGMPIGQVIAFFDHGVPAKRKKLAPYYKSERAERRKILDEKDYEKAVQQLEMTRELFEMLGIACADYDGYEADDCIAASVAKLSSNETRRVIAVSEDRDLLQTINYGAYVWRNKGLVDSDNFSELVGVTPLVYLLYKTLVGDPSDSLPGAVGCGESRAKELSDEFAELESTGASEPMELMTSYQQLEMVRDAFRDCEKLKKYEAAIVTDYARLRKEMEAIDLFIGWNFPRKIEDVFARKTDVNPNAFLRRCKELKFNRVLGDPDRFLGPFRRIGGGLRRATAGGRV